MSRDYKVYLEDIIESTRKINSYISGFASMDELARDSKTFDAVVRNLEVIGEATKNVPYSVREKHPDIEWKSIAGLRDILIHAYFSVDLEIIWDILKNKLPALELKVEAILSDK